MSSQEIIKALGQNPTFNQYSCPVIRLKLEEVQISTIFNDHSCGGIFIKSQEFPNITCTFCPLRRFEKNVLVI